MAGARAEELEAAGAPLVLASGSPQRRAILARLGVAFTVRPPSGVEELTDGEPAALARENALRKARAARAHDASANEVVIACDTVVALDGVVYGKPTDERAARATLTALSGATHEVLSGLVVVDGSAGAAGARELVAVARTRVSFRELPEKLLDWYLRTGEWRERAGAYAIQGAGAALVRAVEGDYENVVGLPLATLLAIYPQLLG